MSRITTIKRFSRDKRGSISVETALILTALLVMAMGVFEFGSVYARKMELTNAVRAGMQYSLVRKPIAGDYSAIQSAVTTALSDHTRASSPTVSVSMRCECRDDSTSSCLSSSGASLICSDGYLRSAYLDISLSETFDLMFLNFAFDNQFTLSESASVRLN